jgi:hypothetical protein
MDMGHFRPLIDDSTSSSYPRRHNATDALSMLRGMERALLGDERRWSTMRALVLVTVMLLVATSCGGGPGPQDARAVAIYSEAIRVVLTEARPQASTARRRGPVFVLAANERTRVSLEVQAGVADALNGFATIHFVDDRAEAIESTEPLKPVHDHGVLLTLGKIPPGHDSVTIEVQRYEQATVTATARIRLRRAGSGWAP